MFDLPSHLSFLIFSCLKAYVHFLNNTCCTVVERLPSCLPLLAIAQYGYCIMSNNGMTLHISENIAVLGDYASCMPPNRIELEQVMYLTWKHSEVRAWIKLYYKVVPVVT